jgi:ABC-type transport system involved in multi-copper enzyme maturation permease subunit
MNLPSTFFWLRCIIRETFRQALAARTFWLMLTVSAVCMVLCVSIAIDEGPPLHRPGEIELIGADDQPLTGPNPHPGTMTLAFGLIRLPLPRDADNQVRFLETLLAFWVAGTLGTLATLIWTAGFLPAFLEPSAAAVLLAKPVPRWVLLAGKCLGVLAFVAFQEAVFFGGTWLALGLRAGSWPGAYLLCIPLFLIHFAVIYSFSALMAVCTRSTVAAIFGGILFWFCCFAMNYGRHAVVALPYLQPQTPFSAEIQALTEVGYWILPKPGDMLIVLDQTLVASDQFEVLPKFVREVVNRQAVQLEMSLLASLVFSAGLLAVAAWQFRTTDY